jgi:hypothetical protein
MTFEFATEFSARENDHEDIEMIKKTSALRMPVLIIKEIGFLNLGFMNSDT